MCTSPIKILNPKKYIKPGSGQPLYLYVPCNHCVECRKRIQLEWRVRTHFEAMEFFSKGGYVLFDTLTYAPLYLPRLNDYLNVDPDLNFSCFSSYHIRQFNTSLNSYLRRRGYLEGRNFRYFITCEYGKEKYTARPHYHCFFFVKDIPVIELSRAIASQWIYGRTDGIPYRSASYVQFHNTFKSLDESSKRVIGYISKYVAKDFVYSDLVKKRLDKLMERKYPCFDWQTDPVCRSERSELERFVVPFHRQSKGFGDFFYKLHDAKNLTEEGSFLFRSPNGQPFRIGLFPSMKRKLFYVHTRKDGVVEWFKTIRGGYYDLIHKYESVKRLDNELLNKNLPQIGFDILYSHNRLVDKPPQTELELEKMIISSQCVNELKVGVLRNYAAVDRDFIRKRVFSFKDYGSKKDGFSKRNVVRFSNLQDAETDCVILLDELKKYMYICPYESSYNKYLQIKKDEGEKSMAVERLKSRINKILKSIKNVCI